MRLRKYIEESLLLLAYHIIRRATHFEPRLVPLLDEFDRLREEL